MSDATVWSEWDSLIVNIINESLFELGEIIEDRLKASINENVYVGQNKQYKSTYEFRESWEVNVINNGRDAEILIKSNPNKMTLDTDNFIHGSNYEKDGSGGYQPNDIRSYIPELLDQNWSGDIFGDGWWRHRNSYMDDLLTKLQASGWLSKKFKELLRKRYNVIGIDNLNDYYDIRLKEYRLKQLKCNKNFIFKKLDVENYDDLKKLFKKSILIPIYTI